MYQTTRFSLNILVATFMLTWSPNFPVEGVPSRIEQCREHGYDFACKYDGEKQPCAVLFCGRSEGRVHPELYKKIPYLGVENGTPCGAWKICKNRKCVPATGVTTEQCPEEDNLTHCVQSRLQRKGPIPTREQQCKKFGFDVACTEVEKSRAGICRDLLCGHKTLLGDYVRYPLRSLPIDLLPSIGTLCGPDKACYGRKCIPVTLFPKHIPKPQYTVKETFWPCRLVPF